MKIFKPLMFAVAGFAIAFLVSFKNEEPKKEYLTFDFNSGYRITYNNEIKKIDNVKGINNIIQENNILNDLAKEGWVLKTCVNSVGDKCFYFERIKQ